MAARILCFASAKGGSGKTSLIATVATFLSKLGKKTLLIDSDFATSGLTLLFLKEVRFTAELIHATSSQPVGLAECLLSDNYSHRVTLSEFLHFIPANFNLSAGLSTADDSVKQRFRVVLNQFREEYDYILIDAQAGSDDMGRISMSRSISDEVVIVSEYDPMSAAGVERLKAILREDLTYDRTWVLLNKILPEFAKSFSDFMEVAKYLSPIPWDASVVRAYARRQLAVDTDGGNEHTMAVLQTLKGLFGDAIHQDLSTWIQSRAAVIRQPIEEQYADAEKEFEQILRQRAQAKQRSLLSRMSFFLGIGLSLITSAFFMLHIFGNFDTYIVSLSDNAVAAISAVSGLLAVFVMALSMKKSERKEVKNKVDEFRYDRQLELVTERLKKLELLKTLDAESLLKVRHSTHSSASSER